MLTSFFEFEDEHSDYMQVDDHALWWHRSDVRKIENWEEHPNGEIKFYTNSDGFRENENLNLKSDSTVLILVTGDSHIDGVVNNDESYPNVLEQLLKTTKYENIEVLNGGVGFYSFRNYYGFIEKFKRLEPDKLIITVFTGNDFRENLLYEAWSDSYLNVLKNVRLRAYRRFFIESKSNFPLNQGIDQTYYFDLYPNDITKSLEIASHYTSKIDSLCKAEKIDLQILLLPSKIEANNTFKNRLNSQLGWNNSIYEAQDSLINSYLSYLESMEIDYLDLTPIFNDRENKLYWDKDHHINIEGHAVIAESIFNSLEN